MQIHGPAHIHGAQALNSPHRNAAAEQSQNSSYTNTADELDISHEADLASRAREVPEIRADRVAEIRRQIESGEYETEERLNLALDRLLDEIG